MSAFSFLLDWLNTLIYRVGWARSHILNLKSYILLNVANVMKRSPNVKNLSIFHTHALSIVLPGTKKWQNADMSLLESYLSVYSMAIVIMHSAVYFCFFLQWYCKRHSTIFIIIFLCSLEMYLLQYWEVIIAHCKHDSYSLLRLWFSLSQLGSARC